MPIVKVEDNGARNLARSSATAATSVGQTTGPNAVSLHPAGAPTTGKQVAVASKLNVKTNGTGKSMTIAKVKKSKKKIDCSDYRTYIKKQSKEHHPDIGISEEALDFMNNFVVGIMHKFGSAAKKSFDEGESEEMSDRDFENAARMVLPIAIFRHAKTRGNLAVKQDMNNVSK